MRIFEVSALVLFFVLPVVAQNQGLGKGAAKVQSDRLEVEHEKRRARFQGNVRAAFGKLKLKCEKMNIAYSENGEVVSLHATGKVEVIRGDARATANQARLDARQGLLVLEGRPVLIQGLHRLEGSRIAVHLKSGRLEVVDASGTFVLGNEDGR